MWIKPCWPLRQNTGQWHLYDGIPGGGRTMMPIWAVHSARFRVFSKGVGRSTEHLCVCTTHLEKHRTDGTSARHAHVCCGAVDSALRRRELRRKCSSLALALHPAAVPQFSYERRRCTNGGGTSEATSEYADLCRASELRDEPLSHSTLWMVGGSLVESWD